MAIQYFTNSAGQFQSREIFHAGALPGAISATVSQQSSTERFYGFGVAITASSCYLLAKMDPQKRRSFLERIYGRNGLGLCVGRISVGSSDYSAELYSYDDVPFDTQLKHFSIDRDLRYVIPMIKEILEINPNMYLFSSPWSPPAWMKTGNSLCGGFMREEFIECYADYYIKFLEAYAEQGIKIKAITPQNEPETHQNGKMPACIWHPETEAKFIKCLRRKLEEKGLDTKIWMWDYRFVGIDRVLWSLENIEGLAESCNGVGFHYYLGNIEQTKKLHANYPNMEMHFTEGGPRLYDHYDNDWCKWGIMISKALCCGYRSFTGWNLLLDEYGGPNIGPYFCGGLATVNSTTGEITYSGQYKAMMHVAPYLTNDSTVYSLITDEVLHNSMFVYPKIVHPLEGFLIKNSTRTVCVMINPDAEKKQVCLEVDGQWWYVELLPDTISTIIL